MSIYFAPAVAATLALIPFVLLILRTAPRRPKRPKRVPAWLATPWLVLAACSHPDAEPPPAPTDECGGTCVAPQICGIGCGEAPGCYTPGGVRDGGTPNDCPACFRDTGLDVDACKDPAYPQAYFCQPGAMPLGGCHTSASVGVECCPTSSCFVNSDCDPKLAPTDGCHSVECDPTGKKTDPSSTVVGCYVVGAPVGTVCASDGGVATCVVADGGEVCSPTA